MAFVGTYTVEQQAPHMANPATFPYHREPVLIHHVKALLVYRQVNTWDGFNFLHENKYQ